MGVGRPHPQKANFLTKVYHCIQVGWGGALDGERSLLLSLHFQGEGVVFIDNVVISIIGVGEEGVCSAKDIV